MTGAGEARTWRCDSCGGAIPLGSLVASARCPFCDEEQRLDGALRQELERYCERVAELEQHAARELDEVTRMRAYRDAHGGGAAGIAARSQLVLFCPNCGARNSVEVGRPVTCCDHCEGPLLPGSTTVATGIAHSRARWREAQQQRIREERRATLWRQGHAYFAGGRWVLLFFAGASLLGLTLAAFTGRLQHNPVLLVTLAALTGGLLLLSVPMLARFGRCRGGRHRELHPLLDRFHGARIRTFTALRRWLDSHWPSYYHPFFLSRSAATDYAALRLQQVQVLLNVHLRQHDLLDTARLHLLLALPLQHVRDEAPQAISWSAEAREAGARLAELGFSADVWEAGVVLQASDETIRRQADQGIDPELLRRALQQGLALARGVEGAGPSHGD